MDRLYFDIESTGNNAQKDRIIDLAIKIVAEDGTVIMNKSKRYNPGIPIDPAATAVHGIQAADVEHCPFFKEDAKKLKRIVEDKVIVTYNGTVFDIPMLMAEFERAGVEVKLSGKFIDVLKLERKINPHTLSATYKKYTGKELTNAHNANADVDATEEILKHQETILKNDDIYEEVPQTDDYSGKLKKDSEGYLVFNFGKNKNKRVIDEADYAAWVLSNDTFSLMVKKLIREEQTKGKVKPKIKTGFKPSFKETASAGSNKSSNKWEPVFTGDDDLPF